MADVDTRVETLEDEIKVLKGEVRRTLVDLRALLMREDSPLNEGTFGRRATLMDNDGEPPVTKREVTEMLKQEVNEQVRPVAQDATPPRTDPVLAGAAMGSAAPVYPSPSPVPMPPPVQNPAWAVAAAPPGVPPSTALPPDPGIAERERRFGEQERRIADQERRIADASHADLTRDRDLKPALAREEPTPEPIRPVVIQATSERGRQEQRADYGPVESGHVESTTTKGPGPDRLEEQDIRSKPPAISERTGQSPANGDQDEQEDRGIERSQPVGGGDEFYQESDDEMSSGQPFAQADQEVVKGYPNTIDESRFTGTEQERPRRSGNPRSNNARLTFDESWLEPTKGERLTRSRNLRSKNEGRNVPRYEQDGGEEEKWTADTSKRNGHGSRVYDEYTDLLAETAELQPEEVKTEATPPLDLNLLSSLTRWTLVARQRVGENRLQELLDLYSQSGHLSASLRELLQKTCAMAGDSPQDNGVDAQVSVDLIFHLHGILAGDLVCRQVPLARVAS